MLKIINLGWLKVWFCSVSLWGISYNHICGVENCSLWLDISVWRFLFCLRLIKYRWLRYKK